jgi:hypothetical protein
MTSHIFEKTFTVTLKCEAVGRPVGWGDAGHEKRWLEATLAEGVREALARYFQCELHAIDFTITLP